MTLQVDRELEDTAIVALHGEIDVSTAAGVGGVANLARSAGYTSLVLDLSDVTFMDSQGVRALLVAHEAMTAAGGSLRVRRPCTAVRVVLDMTGLVGVIAIED